MKTKTPIKILTLTLFVALISGFTLYKGGYLFSDGRKTAYISDPNGGMAVELKTLAGKGFGLNTFQKLKLKGAFKPNYFDRFHPAPVLITDNHLLSSSKSAIIVSREDLKSEYFKQSTTLHDSFLSILLDRQFDTLKLRKEK